jgi:hypothetical protein
LKSQSSDRVRAAEWPQSQSQRVSASV